jgi:hypothetical protein
MLPKNLKYGSKVESAMAESYRSNIAPQNGTDGYGLGTTIIINIPTANNLVLVPTESYLKFQSDPLGLEKYNLLLEKYCLENNVIHEITSIGIIEKYNQTLLNEYFSKHWVPDNLAGPSSPTRISTFIKDDEWLLDVGCGANPFKSLVKNVIGIDPAFDQADVKCTIEEYQPTRVFDVATCLGSINFGDEDIIERQIDKVVSCLAPTSRIYWRLNPGRPDHGNMECFSVPFFPWTFEKLNLFAKKHNYLQTEEKIDENSTRKRFYAEWHRTS